MSKVPRWKTTNPGGVSQHPDGCPLQPFPWRRQRRGGGLRWLRVCCFLVCSLTLSVAMAGATNLRRIVEFQPGTSVTVQQQIVAKSGSKLLHLLPMVHSATIALPMDGVPAALDYLRSEPAVREIHDDPSLATSQAISEGMESNLVTLAAPPQDAYTWNLLQIGLDKVNPAVKGAGIHVAVVDTGIDTSHPALAGVVVGGYNAVTTLTATPAAAGEGGDGEGGDGEGGDSAGGARTTANYQDCNGHGTHVAGIIAGSLTGVAPHVQLHAVRVLDCSGGGHVSDLMQGLSWVYEHPEIRVVNLSLGFYKATWYPLLHRVVKALRDAGVVLVASAGNYRSDCIVDSDSLNASGEGGDGSARTFIINALGCNTRVKFPARYFETIAVAASDITSNMAYYSIHGPEIDVTAPGGTSLTPVLSTTTTLQTPSQVATGEGGDSLTAAGEGGDGEGGDSVGVYGHSSGTSMAAPHVTGVVALMLSVNPTLTPDEVLTILRESANDLGFPMSAQGAGRINAAHAVATAASWSGADPSRYKSWIWTGASVDDSATVGDGTYVGSGSVIDAESQIMTNAEVWNHSSVGHNNTIGENAGIYSGVQLGNNVAVGHNVQVYPGARIGNGGEDMYGTLIGDFTLIEWDVVLGNNIYVGHNAKIGYASRIGDRTLIGKNTVVGWYATIGTNVTIGSDVVICKRQVIANGTVIPDKTMVGRCR